MRRYRRRENFYETLRPPRSAVQTNAPRDGRFYEHVKRRTSGPLLRRQYQASRCFSRGGLCACPPVAGDLLVCCPEPCCRLFSLSLSFFGVFIAVLSTLLRLFTRLRTTDGCDARCGLRSAAAPIDLLSTADESRCDESRRAESSSSPGPSARHPSSHESMPRRLLTRALARQTI